MSTTTHAHREGEPSVEGIHLATTHTTAGDPEAIPFSYGRYHNPGWSALESALGRMENGRSLVFASGMAASHALIAAICTTRKRVVCTDGGYFGIRELLSRLRAYGVDPLFLDLADTDAVRAGLEERPSALWVETPTSSCLEVYDLETLGALARDCDAPMIVDNTTATPALQSPLDLGATASVYSMTKSMSGHSDVLLGAVTTRDEELYSNVLEWRSSSGGIPGPFEAWLAHRGLKTLDLRIGRQSENAAAVADHLVGKPHVRAVHYPTMRQATLALARRQMPRGFGPLLSFEVDGAKEAEAVVRGSRIIRPATSFGGVESTWERRARWKSESVYEGRIRLSLGIEPIADLLEDLDRALSVL